MSEILYPTKFVIDPKKLCDWEEGLSFFPYFFTNLANNNYTLTFI